MKAILPAAAVFAAIAIPHASAQTACSGTTLAGAVRDSTRALIPGAALTLDGKQAATTGSDGQFSFRCVAAGPHRLSVSAPGFAGRSVAVSAPQPDDLSLILQPADVQTEVSVNAEDDIPTIATESSGPTETIAGQQLQQLADDPDDLLRELQQLAAATGGANTTISVDGFQDSTTLPPKSSIAYIKINPDLYAAEYRQPPFDGGHVEVFTKPGQKVFHGALFTTNGSAWENARDPFSVGKTPLGKQRYGFEFNGPIRKATSGFSLALEYRRIDNFAAVDAVTFDSNANPIHNNANVPTPQQLWLGAASTNWQLGPKNTFIVGYTATASHLANVGVGGATLPEAGYDSGMYDHTLRFSDITTASARLMHEARLSLRWNGETDVPGSTAPQLQVVGAFAGGGANIGAQQIHRLTLEDDDDAILTAKTHLLKFGTQFSSTPATASSRPTSTAPTSSAAARLPSSTPTTSPLAKPRPSPASSSIDARSSTARGTATAYSNVAGTPTIAFNEVQVAVFVQDDWNAGHGFHIASGLRYYAQNDPTLLNTITPRLGILWSPSRKGTWSLHAHAGLFGGNLSTGVAAEMLREDGVHRVTSTVYNPVYGNPFLGATPIYSLREYAPHLDNLLWAAENLGGTRALPHGINLTADLYIGRMWRYERTRNINSPLNGNPAGPRPGPANLNILQMQDSGQGRVNAIFAGIEQHTLKYLQFSGGGVRVECDDDTDDNPLFTPQNSTTDAGEFAHRSNQGNWNVFSNSTLTLPKKIQLSTDFHANSGYHYNITTGFDNNGDGDLNDRPQYAPPGTPLCSNNPAASPCAYPTRFGALVASGGIGVFPRNAGVMPWSFHLDMNLQRAFVLTRNARADHQQTVTLNIRSSNVLNHLNVTAVGGVLGSPLFGAPNAADNGRRIEAGARYSF